MLKSFSIFLYYQLNIENLKRKSMCRKALALVKSSHNLNKVVVLVSQQNFICK